RNIAPGLQRAHKHDIASMHWPAMPSDTWQAAIEDARAAETEPDNQLYIHAYDNDERATKLARRAAEEAGVDGDIHIQTRDFADLSTKLEGGCLITNPPYGRRLGERQAAEQLYRDMPGVLRRLSTWAHFILAEHPGFEKLVGQPATRRRKLYNGTVKCTLFSFVPDRRRAHDNDTPQTPAAAFGGTTSTDDNLVQTFQATLAKRWRHFRKWPDRGIEAYRLYDRDTPGVPLAVDRYRDHLHIAEFEGNAPHTAAQHADFLDALCKAASKTTGIERDKIHLKTRRRQRRRQDGIAEGQGQYDRVDDARSVMTTNEHGLKYEVNLSDYLDTGLFLDHRETRKMVREHAHNERVLNLFCYTGSFTVAAAAGGAETTTSVDTSNTYLDWAWRNLELNSLADERHRLVRTDAEQFLVEHPPGEHYDIAIVDPPTFSNNRSEQRVWDVQHDHAHLLQLVAKLMSADGVIYFSNNARRFELADNVPGVAREITNRTTPEDFRRRPAHRCWLLRARPEGW
ncbi:MAG: class I SAM-dependent methyltransferase, partial [Planctomycetota bacterium]